MYEAIFSIQERFPAYTAEEKGWTRMHVKAKRTMSPNKVSKKLSLEELVQKLQSLQD